MSSTSDTFNDIGSWKVFITVGVVLLLMAVFCIMGYDLDRREDHQVLNAVAPNVSSPRSGRGRVRESISVSKTLTSVLSPYFQYSNTWKQRCWGELKLHHPYISLFSRHNREYARPWRGVCLLLNILTVFCIQAVIFTNNTLCDHSTTQIDCESQWLTSWIKTTSVCYWEESSSRRDGDHCSSLQIGGDFQLLLKIVLLSAVFSLPLMLFFSWLIVHVLASDTKAVSGTVSVSDSVVAVGTGGYFWNKRHRQKLLEAQATDVLGLSLTSDFSQFQQDFGRYLRANNSVAVRKICDAWDVSSRRCLLPFKVKKEMSVVRLRTVKELLRFEANDTRDSAISDHILYLFVQDITNGLTRQIIDVKHQQVYMERRETHYLWKLSGYLFVLCVIVAMLVYLYLFGRLQGHDRQQAWFFSALLWLAMDVTVFSTLVVVVQHIAMPSCVMEDLSTTIHHLFTNKMQQKSRGYTASSAAMIIRQGHEAGSSLNAAPYVFVSYRLASEYPQCVASKIVLKYSSKWPRGSSYRGDEEEVRKSWFFSSLLMLLSLPLYLPLLVQESFYRFTSIVLMGALIYVHIYLYNIFPALVVCPLYVFSMLWIIYLVKERKKRNKVDANHSSIVIDVKPLDLEAGGGGGSDVTNEEFPAKRKRSSFFVASTTSQEFDLEALQCVDLNTYPNPVLSKMSANMDDYERYIVQDVLAEAVTEVHERGMDYPLEDHHFNVTATADETLTTVDPAAGSIIITEEEALMNLDSIMSILEANNEESMEHFPRSSMGSVHSFSRSRRSLDSTEKSTEIKEVRGVRGKRSYNEGDDVLYSACQLEDDEQGQSCELVSVVIEEKNSRHDLDDASATLSPRKLTYEQELQQQQQQEMLMLGAEAMQEQMTLAHTAAQKEREAEIDRLIAQRKQITADHLKSQELRQPSAEGEEELSFQETSEKELEQYEVELAKVTSAEKRLQLEHDEAERRHKTELRGVQEVLAATKRAAPISPSRAHETRVTFSPRVLVDEEDEGEADIDVLGVSTMQDFMKRSKKKTTLHPLSEQHEQEQLQQQQEKEQQQTPMIQEDALFTQVEGLTEREEPEMDMSEVALAAKQFVGGIIDKYFHTSDCDEGSEDPNESVSLSTPIKEDSTQSALKFNLDDVLHEHSVEVTHVDSSPSTPTKDDFVRKANKTTFYLSPPQKEKRKEKLLADAEKILSLSQSKKEKVPDDENDVDVDVDILPVFSAWCDDVFDELNSNDHKSPAWKLRPMSRENRNFTSSPVDQNVKLDEFFPENEGDTPSVSVVSTPVHSPAKLQQPDYDQAFRVLSNPKSVTDGDILQRVLISLGVSEAEDLAHLDDDDLRLIFNHLKKISLKKFKRFLCRDMM